MNISTTIRYTLNICLLVGLLHVAYVAVANEVDVKVPQNAELAWVSSNINQNGMQLSIRTFRSPESVDEVFEFYRETWFHEGDVPGFVENDMGEWKLISQLRDQHNIVVQLKPAEEGGSTGFLSIAEKNPERSAAQVDFPMPDGTERFSSTYTEENDSQVHTMTFLSSQSIGSAASFYKSRLERKGWELARESEHKGSEFMIFNRKGDRLELVVTEIPGPTTVIYANRVVRNG